MGGKIYFGLNLKVYTGTALEDQKFGNQALSSCIIRHPGIPALKTSCFESVLEPGVVVGA